MMTGTRLDAASLSTLFGGFPGLEIRTFFSKLARALRALASWQVGRSEG